MENSSDHSAQLGLMQKHPRARNDYELELELELELIQTQMAQKPMLRAEVYAHAMRASQNR